MRVSVGLLVVVVLAGCGDGDQPVTAGDASGVEEVPADAPRYTASATVLESDDHGPQLCLGGVQLSYPPQCGGPEVLGWSWDEVDGSESRSGTTWGEYTVVGTFDGARFTLTEPPGPPSPVGPPLAEPDYTSPCPPPPGGWAVVDPATTTFGTQTAAMEHARSQPDFAGAWLDQTINPAADEPVGPDEMTMNDPQKLVLNLRFTGDLHRHEAEIRQIWGGALCISEADRPLRELEEIQQEVHVQLGGQMLHSYVDEVRGVVEVGVILADPSVQGSLDERYGEGTVVLTGALQPVGP